MFLPPVRPSDGQRIPRRSVLAPAARVRPAGASVTLEENSYKYLQIREIPVYRERRRSLLARMRDAPARPATPSARLPVTGGEGTRRTSSPPGLLPRLRIRPARPSPVDRWRWSAGACFRSFGLRVGVRVHPPGVLPRLLERLPPGWRPSSTPVVDQIYSLRVGDASRGAGRAVRVYAGDEQRLLTRDLDEALAAIESEIRQGIAAAAPRRTFVHAGAVGWRGRAILVPGRSRCGKTTLVAALVRRGAAYLSDEYAVLDGEGRVHPFAKPLSIRGAGGCDRHAARVPVATLGGRSAARAVPVGLVAFTAFVPGAVLELSALSPGRAVLEMLRHTVPARLRPESSLDALGAAVAGARVVAGERGDADAAAEALIAALEEVQPGPAPAARRERA